MKVKGTKEKNEVKAKGPEEQNKISQYNTICTHTMDRQKILHPISKLPWSSFGFCFKIEFLHCFTKKQTLP